MNDAAAETLALQALTWLAADSDGFGRFLGESGVDPAMLQAGDLGPELLAGVLDHILADEARLLAFCAAVEIPANLPARARRHLPGANPED